MPGDLIKAIVGILVLFDGEKVCPKSTDSSGGNAWFTRYSFILMMPFVFAAGLVGIILILEISSCIALVGSRFYGDLIEYGSLDMPIGVYLTFGLVAAG